MKRALDCIDIACQIGGVKAATGTVASAITTIGVGTGSANSVGTGIAATAKFLATFGGPSAKALTAISVCNPVGLGGVAIGLGALTLAGLGTSFIMSRMDS